MALVTSALHVFVFCLGPSVSRCAVSPQYPYSLLCVACRHDRHVCVVCGVDLRCLVLSRLPAFDRTLPDCAVVCMFGFADPGSRIASTRTPLWCLDCALPPSASLFAGDRACCAGAFGPFALRVFTRTFISFRLCVDLILSLCFLFLDKSVLC